MKRVLSFILAVFSILLCLAGCSGGEKYSYESFFGVVDYSEELSRLVVYIPSYGDVELPACKSCTARFDESEGTDYQLKDGDLVEISFRYERAWDEHGVAIMETYPARFDRSAEGIEAIRENISYKKVDKGYLFSFPKSAETQDLGVGDTVSFIQHGGKDGAAYEKLYAEGEIVSSGGDILTVFMKFYEDEYKFLAYYDGMTVEHRLEPLYGE